MNTRSSITIILLSVLLTMLVVHPIYFTNLNRINNKSIAAFAQTESSGVTHNITTFHAKGLIGTLLSHLISEDVIRSLGFANSTNLLNGTFLAKSAIRNALVGNISPRVYLAAGTWNLDVINGKVKDLIANFTQVTTTGINPHTHTITNYKPGNSSNSIELDSTNKNLRINGYVDVWRNGQSVKNWINVPVKIYISRGNVISIDVDPMKTDFHFGGMPIFGIVTSLTDQNNNDVRTSALKPKPQVI
jgi:hypothetical protein